MKRMLLCLVLLTSLIGCAARPDQPRKKAGKANVRRSYLSPDAAHHAILRKDDDGYRVRVDEQEYGPFVETDLLEFSPFQNSSEIWAFRAISNEGVQAVIQGRSYGPFQAAWRIVRSGPQWGCLAQREGKYFVLVDGSESSAYDAVVGNHRLDAFELPGGEEPDVPLFYGDKQWAFFAKNGNEKFVVTSDKQYGPYAGFANFDIDETPVISAVILPNLVSFDRSTLGLGVSKTVDGATTHHLWINGQEHGPFAESVLFEGLLNMSFNGKAWAVATADSVVTDKGAIPRLHPAQPKINDDGKTIVYEYGDSNQDHYVVNDDDSGPFANVNGIGVSPDGNRWMAVVQPTADDKWYLHTESEKLGPFDSVSFARFVGDHSLAGVKRSEVFSILVDGKDLGAFKDFLFEMPTGFRTNDKSWYAAGIRPDQQVEVYDSGKSIGFTGPFEKISLVRASDPKWSGLARNGDQSQIVESGAKSEPFTLATLLRHHRSADSGRMAVDIQDANHQKWVVLRDRKLGPYNQFPSGMQISDDGAHWGFRLPVPDDRAQIVHDLGESPHYDHFHDFRVGQRGATFVGLDGDECFIHIGDQKHGPFDSAGLVVKGDVVKAVIVQDGTVVIREF